MSKSVYLRAFCDQDASEINKWRNNPKVMSLTCGQFRYVGLDMEKEWVHGKIMNNIAEEYFAICLSDGSDKIIGYQCIRNIDMVNRSAYAAGIVLSPKYQDGTYMMDASLLLFEYAFNRRNLRRIETLVLDDNIGSHKLHEKLGYK